MHVRKLSIAVGLVAFSLPTLANDWPQWRGPDRTDVSKETGLLKAWPANGPRLLWTCKDAGTGYSGPAVVGNRLYTMGATETADTVFALDVNTGKRLWTKEIGKRITLDRGDGPRGTPTVADDRLYVIGSQGELTCLDKSGAEKWSVSLVGDLGGTLQKWGYSESPLVDGNKVICTPGGSKGAIAALDKNTGKVLWQSKELKDLAAYSSAIAIDMDGKRQYVQATKSHVVGVAADDGRLLWQSSAAVNGVATIPTPIFDNGRIYSSSGYGAGCALLKLVTSNGSVNAEKRTRSIGRSTSCNCLSAAKDS